MSEQYPECPLYSHDKCNKMNMPSVCALVREDKKCLKPQIVKGVITKRSNIKESKRINQFQPPLKISVKKTKIKTKATTSLSI